LARCRYRAGRDKGVGKVASTFRRLACVLLFAIPLAVSSTAGAQQWAPVGTDAEDNTYSVDASRILRDDSMASVRVRTEYARPREVEAAGVYVFVALDQMVINCANGTFAIQTRTLVAADGTEMPRGTTPRDELRFRAAAAGSMSETIVRFVCAPAARSQDRG
jgi:hypothetical protein